MTTTRDVIADARATAEVLDSARRYGLPMPYSINITDHSVPSLQVAGAEALHQWAGYLEHPTRELVRADRSDHLWLYGSDQDFRLRVIAIVPAGAGAQHILDSDQEQ